MSTKGSQRFDKKLLSGLHKEYGYHRYPEFWENFENLSVEARIVDMGCGSGVVAAKLLERGFTNISLVDIHDYRSFDAVKRLPFYRRNLNFDPLPFADASQDFVVAPSLIEHLENPFFFIRECERVLKPGGRLVITTYIGWNWISRLLFLKHGIVEGYQGSNNHISFLPRNIFFWAFRDFELEREWFHRRTHFFLAGIRIPFQFPRSERWSAIGGYCFRKNYETHTALG